MGFEAFGWGFEAFGWGFEAFGWVLRHLDGF